MEKNKNVLEFAEIVKNEIPKWSYENTRGLFLDYVEWISMPWKQYVNSKTKEEIIKDFKYFSMYIYLPF